MGLQERIERKYSVIRDSMKPGDVIAFSGKKAFSQTIKLATRSNVSHVGVVLQTKLEMNGESHGRLFNQVAEATASGVKFTNLSELEENYEGELWWLPLSRESRRELERRHQAFFDFLIDSIGAPFDSLGALIRAWEDTLDFSGVTWNEEDFGAFFCSELVAGALEVGGVIKDVNASEVTPINLCRFNIYAEEYVQFKGERKDIRRFNSVDPTGWGNR